MHGSQMTRITNHRCTESNHVYFKELIRAIYIDSNDLI